MRCGLKVERKKRAALSLILLIEDEKKQRAGGEKDLKKIIKFMFMWSRNSEY